MKAFLVALCVAVSGLTLGVAPFDVEAKRLGGGRAAGMQRTAPKPPQHPQTPPQQPAQPAPQAGAAAPAAAGAAAAAGKRSWLGPVAGLAAGLGIAALLSHFGLGEGLANFLTLLLLAAAAFFVIRWLLRRFAGGAAPRQGGLQYAGAGAPAGGADAWPSPMQRQAAGPLGASGGVSPAASSSGALTAGGAGAVGAAAGAGLPADFDAEGFTRIAKMLFIRLQAANDAGQVEDLRKFTTPELFASLRLDLQERGGAAQQTDVVQLDAQVLDAVQEQGQWIVSVRFHGLIREEAEATAEPFDESWHFVRPLDGSRDWAIAGITPAA